MSPARPRQPHDARGDAVDIGVGVHEARDAVDIAGAAFGLNALGGTYAYPTM